MAQSNKGLASPQETRANAPRSGLAVIGRCAHDQRDCNRHQPDREQVQPLLARRQVCAKAATEHCDQLKSEQGLKTWEDHARLSQHLLGGFGQFQLLDRFSFHYFSFSFAATLDLDTCGSPAHLPEASHEVV